MPSDPDPAVESATTDAERRPSARADPLEQAAPQTRAELLGRARRYAATVDLDVDLAAVSWEVSKRAKRRAGACLFDRDSESVTIRLTWAAYEHYGWPEFAEVIRHELVHAWEFQRFGESGHGERFRRTADAVDAPRHCRSFTDARLRLVCTSEDCEWSAERHRAATTVTRPAERRCGSCGAEYLVEHVPTGERWRTHSEYESARERIGEEW